MVPAWVALHTLRRTGCALPVELWFLAHEMPDAGALRWLAQSLWLGRALKRLCRTRRDGARAGRAGRRCAQRG